MKNVAFIGAGNMNGAIISGLVHNGYPRPRILLFLTLLLKNA